MNQELTARDLNKLIVLVSKKIRALDELIEACPVTAEREEVLVNYYTGLMLKLANMAGKYGREETN